MVPLTWFCFLILTTVVLADDKLQKIRIKTGLLQGTRDVSTKGKQFFSFKGIPYAYPPINENRFKVPQPLTPWRGSKNATKYASHCLQLDMLTSKVTGNEDCLFLNVFTTKIGKGVSLPVLVFIPGGFYMNGGSELYDPVHLMDKDMVVVTVNYRLGPLGFFSTGDKDVSGNMGLKDQSYALNWVQENIPAFGGNPKEVTLMGDASVSYHLISPLSKGTFSRGIGFSGTAFNPWAFASKPKEHGNQLAAIVGCPNTKCVDKITCLRKKSGQDIISAQLKMFPWKYNRFYSYFTPVIEPVGVKNAFLTQHPYEAVKKGVTQKMPVIFSNTAMDGLYPAAAFLQNYSILEDLNKQWLKIWSNLFIYEDTSPPQLRTEVANQINQKYLDHQPINRVTFSALVRGLTDRLFATGVGEFARSYADTSKQPVYVFRYGYEGVPGFGLASLLAKHNETFGAGHGDDISHIFKVGGRQSNSANDTAMTNVLVDMVYNFATTGVPKIPGNTTWLPVSPQSSVLHYLDIVSPTQLFMNLNYHYGESDFWESLKFNENANYHS